MASTSKNIFDNFKMYFPMIAKESASWWNGPDMEAEITVKLLNNDIIIFDDIEKTVRAITNIGESFNTDLTEDIWKREFSIKLRRMVRRKGLSQSELSELTGISTNTISSYMTRRKIPNAYNLRKIAIVLDCSSSDLIDFDI